MKVKDIMIREVKTLHDSMTYEEAAAFLHKHHISGEPVVNDLGNLRGILSEKDLFKALHPDYQAYFSNPEIYLNYELQEEATEQVRRQPIVELMNARPLTINPETPIMKAGAIMLARSVHRLPVVEDGVLVGLVTRKNIYRRLFEKHLNLRDYSQSNRKIN